MDIVIYMNKKDFNHKTDVEMYDCYWSMLRIPRLFTEDDRIYFAANGKVQGYVECNEFNPDDVGGETIMWDGETYIPLAKPIPRAAFRGFRYRWWSREDE